MSETPLWITIAALFLGPAVAAAILGFVFNKLLNKQKSSLDEAVQKRLAEQKSSLDEAVQKRLMAQSASLEAWLHSEKLAVDESNERRRRRLEYVSHQQQALRKGYLLVFEAGAKATPAELLTRLQNADREIMEPFRAFEGELQPETKDRIYEVHNFLVQAIPSDGSHPSRETLLRLRQRKDGYLELQQEAINALRLEREAS